MSHSGAVAADLDLHNSSVSKQCVDFDPPAMILGVEREEEDGLFIISSYSLGVPTMSPILTGDSQKLSF